MTISSTAGANSSINGKVTLNKLNANYLANNQDIKITGNDIDNIIDASLSLQKLNIGGGKGNDFLIASHFGFNCFFKYFDQWRSNLITSQAMEKREAAEGSFNSLMNGIERTLSVKNRDK